VPIRYVNVSGALESTTTIGPGSQGLFLISPEQYVPFFGSDIGGSTQMHNTLPNWLGINEGLSNANLQPVRFRGNVDPRALATGLFSRQQLVGVSTSTVNSTLACAPPRQLSKFRRGHVVIEIDCAVGGSFTYHYADSTSTPKLYGRSMPPMTALACTMLKTTSLGSPQWIDRPSMNYYPPTNLFLSGNGVTTQFNPQTYFSRLPGKDHIGTGGQDPLRLGWRLVPLNDWQPGAEVFTSTAVTLYDAAIFGSQADGNSTAALCSGSGLLYIVNSGDVALVVKSRGYFEYSAEVYNQAYLFQDAGGTTHTVQQTGPATEYSQTRWAPFGETDDPDVPALFFDSSTCDFDAELKSFSKNASWEIPNLNARIIPFES